MAQSTSKLSSHGFRFCNWAGPGEEAATKFGISHAVVVPPNIRTVIVGGQIGVKDDGTVPTDLAEEITEAFDNVERSLKAAGLGDDAWEHVYSITTYEVEKDGQGITEVVLPIAKKYLKKTKPVWTGITVKALVFPGLHIEITVQAFLPNSDIVDTMDP
ncbi:Endoribonuclease L-PSP/chorismate mutase-like protein [Phialemonium atrogriseum]|uniref:Endoribonuclease L-PSP/chorismate mutase-like protein n=1 Tax=Phialemonium atrogriseum TaxID=1093897 RepID=A0AAJ0BT42_9PEZI|nr:Endoribonuclease L-PSP/chorismate mutase-like protein [Phialemonium atrogriseum]KAK1764004.1 Endoribonuclease L-PSP/chorismate mutase-like protein [Phialemonium atrogriseum]